MHLPCVTVCSQFVELARGKKIGPASVEVMMGRTLDIPRAAGEGGMLLMLDTKCMHVGVRHQCQCDTNA